MNDPDRIAEILGEYHERRADGEGVDAEELLRANPELGDALRARLQALDALDCALDRSVDDVPAPDSSLPRAIGEYHILREIGRGGMGTVYEAEQASMQRRVALKVLAPTFTASRRAVKRFQREARAAGRLHHTNIVPIYDLDEHRGCWHYAMELVPGPTLADVLTELGRRYGPPTWGRFVKLSGVQPADEAGSAARRDGSGSKGGGGEWFRRLAAMFAEVAEALQLAHDEGVVHRDIKPSNLLLDADGRLKIVDFGLACLEGEVSSLTRSGDFVGTPAYMSPEQAAARRLQIDHRTDIYSLGATLYEALTLRPPFQGRNLEQLCVRIISTDPALPRRSDARIPRDLETIALKAMEKRREQRYQKASELAQDLRSFCRGEGVRARRAGVVGRTWRRIRRQPIRSALIAALLALGTAAALLGWHAGREAEQRRRAEYDVLLLLGERVMAQSEEVTTESDSDGCADGSTTALGLFDSAAELMPGRPEAWWLRALVSGRSTEQRVGDVDRAVERGLPPRSGHLMRAHFYAMGRELEEADLEQRRAADCAGETTAVETYLLSRLAGWRGEHEAALPLADRAVEASEPGSAVRYLAHRARANLREEVDDLAGALIDLQATVGLGDERLSVRIEMACLRRALGNIETADREFAELLDVARRGAGDDPWLFLIRGCRKRGESGWLEIASREAVAARPQSAEILHLRFHALQEGHDPSAALQVSDLELKLRNGDPLALYHRGLALRDLGQFKKARASFKAAVSPDSSFWQAQQALGVLLSNEFEEYELALACFDRAVEESPSYLKNWVNRAIVQANLRENESALWSVREAFARGEDGAKAHRVHGRILKQQGKPEAALEALERAEARDPSDPETLILLGLVLKKCRRPAEARGKFEKILSEDRDHLAANLELGTLLSNDGGEHRLALVHFEVVLAQQPNHARALANRGVVWRALGELEDALDSFREAGECGADSAWYHHEYGVALGEAGRLELAHTELQEACRQEPLNAKMRFHLALTLSGRGEQRQAISDYRTALELDPQHLGARLNLATLLYQVEGDLEEALRQFEIALGSAPDYPKLHFNRGLVLLDQGRLHDALAALDRAEELDPDYSAARKGLDDILSEHAATQHQLGLALVERGEVEEAIECYRLAIRLKPDFAEAHSNLCNLLRESGGLEEAIIHGHRATELDPDLDSAHINLGAALQASGKPDEAIECYERALDLSPGCAVVHYNLGAVFWGQQRLEKAIESYQKAIELEAEYAEAYCNLAWVFRGRGEYREALEAAQKGHELGSRRSLWLNPSAELVEQCRELVKLEGLFPEFVSGDGSVETAREALGLSSMAYHKRHYELSTRLYREAFRRDPGLVNQRDMFHRYNAACAAVLAGCGQGEDAGGTAADHRTTLRRLALEWLRADLVSWKTAISDGEGERAEGQLRHWLEDLDLAWVRDEERLADLPEEEVQEWRELWSEVRKRVRR